MIVRSLWLQNFMSHENTTLTLPETGVVVVTGSNGSGKSSIMEAIAMGVWGKTLRGASPWVTGKDGCVSVAFGDNTAMRMRKGSKTNLHWAGEDTKYETTRKAQKALDEIVGPFDVWRRCSVFSSHDAAHFTMASDGERKRLLESVLGLDQFDNALVRCREDLKKQEREISRIQSEVNIAYNSLEYEKKALAEHRAMLQSLMTITPAGSSESVATDKAKLSAVDGEIRELEQAINTKLSSLHSLKAEKIAADSKLKLLEQEVCYTCGQTITAETHKRIATAAVQASHALDTQTAEAHNETKGLREDLDELKDYYRELFAKIQKEESEINSKSWVNAEITKVQLKTEAAEVTIRTASQNISKLEEEYTAAARRLTVLEHSQKVLGLKGVRAHVLGTALEGLESLANMWVRKISGEEIEIEIKPYTEKKTGGTSDAIGLVVRGVGGGHGYKGASGGQRRRIDVSLLLALADLAQASHGKEDPGTIFFDEVFDSLDVEGIEAVSAALAEMGETRPVVVITHSTKLAEQLEYTARLHIDKGKVV